MKDIIGFCDNLHPIATKKKKEKEKMKGRSEKKLLKRIFKIFDKDDKA